MLKEGILSFDLTDPVSEDGGAITVSYGEGNEVRGKYDYPDNDRGTKNQVKLRIPLKFNIEFNNGYTAIKMDTQKVPDTIFA